MTPPPEVAAAPDGADTAGTADTGMFRSLRVRNFRLFFLGQSVSQAGTWVQMIAQTLLVLKLTNSGVALGLVTACQFLPILLLGPWAGLVADRVDKRRLMLATQSTMMVLAFTLGLLTITGHVGVVQVYLLAALTGVANAFDNPTRRSFVTQMVPTDHVANAVSLTSALMTGSRIAGPALAGLLITTVGHGWCFLLNGATFVAVLIGLARMDTSDLRMSPLLPRGKGQVREGLRYVQAHPELRTPLLMVAVVGTLAFNFQVLVPLLATRTLEGDAGTYTLLSSLMSAGSLGGSLFVARRTSIDLRLIVAACAAFGMATAVFSISPNLAVALVAIVAVGATGLAFMSSCMTVIQLRSDAVMLGRVNALYTMVFLGSTPIGGPIAGWVAEHLGIRAGLGMGAAATLAAAAWGWHLLRDSDARARVTDEAPVALAD
ncbi:MAG: MFS transporter [Actinomycetota bacterium]|nr:MFS transporter [Actinomycetota bacterium]